MKQATVQMAVIVRPGDTVLVAVPHQATNEQVKRLHEGLKLELPDVNFVVLTAQQMLVYRPDGA
ncbi:MAG TPA: hypothetical protein VF506_22560 [Streptosporangiaceae bacterium]